MARRPIPLWQSIPLRLVVTGAALAVAGLPRRLELSAGRALGRILLLCAPRRRAVAEENLRRCLSELSDAERARLLKRNFEHFGVLALELLHMFCPLPGHFRRYVRKNSVLGGREVWEAARAKGKGVIFAGNHVGNWEIVAALGALNGMEVTIVTRNLVPAWFHATIEAARRSVQVASALPPKTLPAVLKALRQGRSVVFAMDQYATPEMGGIKARFFGYEVDTLGAIAVLARKTGAAVLSGSSYRDEAGKIRMVVEPELKLGGEEDPSRDTQTIVDRSEAHIRAHPEQWTWGHRRFKHVDWSDRRPSPPAGGS